MLDSAKVASFLGSESIMLKYSNKSSVILAYLTVEVQTANPQVPQYEDIIVL